MKAEKHKMSVNITKLSAELNMVKLLCAWLKSAQPQNNDILTSQPVRGSPKTTAKHRREVRSESEELEEIDIPKKFKCKKCDFEDKGSHNVSTHNLKTHWKYIDDRFECKICEKIFSKKERTKRYAHMRVICKKRNC